MKKILSLVALLAGAITSFAQITLTQSDIAQPGDTIWYSYDTVNVSTSLAGSAGANQTWNFASAANHEKAPTWFLDPANSPVTPPANITHVLVEKEITAVSFLNVSASGLTTVQPNPVAFLGGPAFLSLKSMTFPLQYQSLTKDSTATQVVVDANSVGVGTLFDSVRISFKISLHSLCDGWGSLITPKGTYNSLRLKNTINITFKFDGKTKFIGNWVNIPVENLPVPVPEKQKEVSYMWIGTNSKYVLAQADMVTDQETEQDEFYYQTDKPVIVSGLQDFAKNNVAVAAYPNPASAESNLEFALEAPSEITVRLYDLTGRLVNTLAYSCVAGSNRITINTRELPAGFYTANITGTGVTGIAKINVIR